MNVLTDSPGVRVKCSSWTSVSNQKFIRKNTTIPVCKNDFLHETTTYGHNREAVFELLLLI